MCRSRYSISWVSGSARWWIARIRPVSIASRGVALTVFDVTGRRVRSLVAGDLDAGSHAVRWDGRDELGQRAASGMYFYKLEAGGSTLTRKMLLVK